MPLQAYDFSTPPQSILKQIYRKTTVFSVSPLLGGSEGADFLLPYPPIDTGLPIIDLGRELNPYGDSQKELFDETNAARFKQMLAGYHSYMIMGSNYFDYHMIDSKNPDGFMASDFKKMAKK